MSSTIRLFQYQRKLKNIHEVHAMRVHLVIKKVDTDDKKIKRGLD